MPEHPCSQDLFLPDLLASGRQLQQRNRRKMPRRPLPANPVRARASPRMTQLQFCSELGRWSSADSTQRANPKGVMREYAYAVLAIAALALLGWATSSVYEAGKTADEASCEKVHRYVADAAAAEVSRKEQVGAYLSNSMLSYLAANLPPIELKTHEAAERVRIIHRDRSPVHCARAVRVQQELDSARERAASAGRLRA